MIMKPIINRSQIRLLRQSPRRERDRVSSRVHCEIPPGSSPGVSSGLTFAVSFLFDISGKILLEWHGFSMERDAHTPLGVFLPLHGYWFRSTTPGRNVPK